MALKFDGRIPIYIQIMDMIKLDIVTGKLKGGEKLASVREMAENLKVNPNTIQRVYQELEREGITYTQRGTGTFITEDKNIINALKKEISMNVIKTFIEGMTKLGFTNEEIIKAVVDYFKGGKDNGNDI